MPIELYKRGSTWWAKGKFDYDGRAITDYIRCSTGASTKSYAERWLEDFKRQAVHRHLFSEKTQNDELTFLDLVEMYDPTPDMAKYLVPIIDQIGHRKVKSITPALIRSLGPDLYPENSTDSWRRWVITPARAVINNGHDHLGGDLVPAITIKGYTKKERETQDIKRGKKSRVPKKPGSWDWILKFRQHARPRDAALALTMFMTGTRIGQAVRMHPKKHLDLQNGLMCRPAGKGHDDEWIKIPAELVTDLANLPKLWPRGYDRTEENLRLFGYADKDGPRKSWQTACKKAEIDYLPPHSAGRHGFGQEMRIRQAVDKEAVARAGGWDDPEILDKAYTHAEDVSDKIFSAFRTGLVQAERETGLKLLKD